MNKYLAIDLGAESGRIMRGSIAEGVFELTEIHRFPTGMLSLHRSYFWNIYRFYEEILNGFRKYAALNHSMPVSIGVDTWGVDYGLKSKEGKLIGLPHTYRDKRTESVLAEFNEILTLEKIYDLTGIQMLPFNTLFQLYAESKINPGIFDKVSDLLFIPDILNYFLTGIKKTEFTFATTSQLLNPFNENWEPLLFNALRIDPGIMQEVNKPCTVLGKLSKEISENTGLRRIPVISVASHDTASAIAAIPAEGENWAFMSTGTWALIGFENDRPIINTISRKYNFTNEGGINGFRVLKNMTGFWILQKCRSSWGEKEFDYEKLTAMAQTARPFTFYIDPDDPDFLNPTNMIESIHFYCKKTNQQMPAEKAEIVRGILESLALKTRCIIDEANEIREEPIEKIYITGGGVHNKLFCQFVANATGLDVITVLAEGTAAGNVIAQAIAMGDLQNLEEGRKLIGNSIKPEVFNPKEIKNWEGAYQKFNSILNKNN
ncbi:MAG: rhamnulokinase [Bacteroidales bacterium]|nr:rhamnulokinase [Bacteroidales bacterium]